MLIHFERTGGFAGTHIAFTLNTEMLSLEDARELQKMVETADFFNLPEIFPLPKRGANYFQFILTVETENKRHTVEVSEPAVPAGLRPLLKYLVMLDKNKK